MKARVVFSKEAEAFYGWLRNNANDKTLIKSIDRKIELIKVNPFVGDALRKGLIPKEYKTKFGVTSLYRIELAHAWRLIYTIKGNKIEIVTFVLEILNHKRYDKRFSYK